MSDTLSDRINSLPDWARKHIDELLPDWARQYIHDLETRADPAGDVQELADLRDQRDALLKRVEELEAAVAAERGGKHETAEV